MRIRSIFVAAFWMCVAFPSSVHAEGGWRVVDTAGAVRIGGPGMMPVALTREQELPADSWVETGKGRAVLVRGLETVIVEPNSRIMLPGERVNGNTQVLQTIGSAIYKIGKQRTPHFQVDTPYLAALVKGTAFTVVVDETHASVVVTEGLVEVTTPRDDDSEFVRPGFTARVLREKMDDVVVDPTPDGGDDNAPGTGKSSDSKTQAVVITRPIGELDLNVKEVSNGLAIDDVPAVTADAGSTKDYSSDGASGGSNSGDNGKSDTGGTDTPATPDTTVTTETDTTTVTDTTTGTIDTTVTDPVDTTIATVEDIELGNLVADTSRPGNRYARGGGNENDQGGNENDQGDNQQ